MYADLSHISELFRVCFGFRFKTKVKNRKIKFQFSIFDFKSENEKRFDFCFLITKLKRNEKISILVSISNWKTNYTFDTRIFQFSIFDFKSENEKQFDFCFLITKLKRKTKKFQFWFLFQMEKRIILSIHGLKLNPWPERVNLIFNLNWIENWKKFNFQFLILNWILKFKAIFNFHFSSRIFDI